MLATDESCEVLEQVPGDRQGKYLTFALGEEEYGLEILKVREIIGYMNVTSVPHSPPYIEGVINLRGQVIPVIDLRAKFGMETVNRTDQTCIVVIETTLEDSQISTGLVVDHVCEVLDIPAETIEDAPNLGVNFNTDFILGMGKIDQTVKTLLNIDKVLSNEDLTNLVSQMPKDQET